MVVVLKLFLNILNSYWFLFYIMAFLFYTVVLFVILRLCIFLVFWQKQMENIKQLRKKKSNSENLTMIKDALIKKICCSSSLDVKSHCFICISMNRKGHWLTKIISKLWEKKKTDIESDLFLYFYTQILSLNEIWKFELNTTLKVNKITILQVINMRNRFWVIMPNSEIQYVRI